MTSCKMILEEAFGFMGVEETEYINTCSRKQKQDVDQ